LQTFLLLCKKSDFYSLAQLLDLKAVMQFQPGCGCPTLDIFL